jgi:signal transduction histidine kinase
VIPVPESTNRIQAAGEMADRVRGFDWSQSPVGEIAAWTDELAIAVNMLLGSKQPMLLLWGPELVQFYNDSFVPSLGEKHPLSLGQAAKVCWAEIWDVIRPQFETVLRGESVWFEDQLIPVIREGKLTDVYWTYSYSPFRDGRGEIGGILVVCAETTRRKVEADLLREERMRLYRVLQQAPFFFALLEGPEHRLTMTNPLYLQLVGHRDVQGKLVAEALPEAVEQGYLEILNRVYTTGEPHDAKNARFDLVAKPGGEPQTRYLDFVYQAVREPDGSVGGIMVLGIDITERRQTERALIQSEKLAAVGRLAASIAHEINNPLESVTNLLFLARAGSASSEVMDYLEQAEVELRRISAITHQTLSFNRQAAGRRSVTARELFGTVVNLYQSRLRNAGIEVTNCESSSSPVLCYEGEIRQVLNNLVVNAIDAMPGGGRLVLRCRDAKHPRTGQAGVVLTVADTGEGMSAAVAERVFEPFFTTKGLGGTGLGMWLSRQIVERHRGALSVRSSEDPRHQGTVVSVFLPLDSSV